MSALLDNAIASILIGLQDYGSPDDGRPLGAVQNYYAGIVLLAKEALVRPLMEKDD